MMTQNMPQLHWQTLFQHFKENRNVEVIWEAECRSLFKVNALSLHQLMYLRLLTVMQVNVTLLYHYHEDNVKLR